MYQRDLLWILALAILLNSSLYLTGCFVAGLVIGNAPAWRLSLAALGATYLCYLAQYDRRLMLWPRVGQILVLISIALGVLAGLALLV